MVSNVNGVGDLNLSSQCCIRFDAKTAYLPPVRDIADIPALDSVSIKGASEDRILQNEPEDENGERRAEYNTAAAEDDFAVPPQEYLSFPHLGLVPQMRHILTLLDPLLGHRAKRQLYRINHLKQATFEAAYSSFIVVSYIEGDHTFSSQHSVCLCASSVVRLDRQHSEGKALLVKPFKN